MTNQAPDVSRSTGMTSEQLREERAYVVGVQAALWGRPLAENLQTLAAGLEVNAVGLNYYRKFPNLKTAADRFVNTPNNATIDAYCTFDVRTEPLVVSVPALTESRWTIVQVGDFFDEVIQNIGGGKGSQPGLYLVTGPDYHGPIPANMTEMRSRTAIGVVANRVFVQGETDLPGARKVQEGFHVLPLSVFQQHGLKYEVVAPDPAPYVYSPQAPETLRPFEAIGTAMRLFLSASDDTADPMIVSFHMVGLSVARGFAWQALDEATVRGLTRAASAADQIVADAYAHSAEIVNGWRYTMAGGRAGHDLALRAALASNLLGANVAEQMLYPNNRVDDQGQPLSGKNTYILHFPKDALPPVSVFWNLAMYDEKEFFIENDFKRYTIGSTTDGLKTADDGSITIFIQHDDPGAEKQSNWLPAPEGIFNLTMRLYGAQSSILDGSYRLPAVTRA